MRSLRTVGILAVLAGCLAVAPSASAVNATYDFSSGNQGWRVAQTNGPPFVPADWLGGYIAAQDTGDDSGCQSPGGTPCNLFYFASPGTAAPLAANYGGTISFDLASNVTPEFAAVLYIDSVVDSAPELRRNVPVTATTNFQHLSVPLTETGWQICQLTPGDPGCAAPTQAQFRSVLASATYTDILADLVSGPPGEVYSLDNFKITEPAAKKPKKKCKKAKKKRGKRAGAAAKKKKKCGKKKGKKKRRSLAAGASSLR